MPTVPRGPVVEGRSTRTGAGTKPPSLAALVGQLNVGADLQSRNPLPLVCSAWGISNVGAHSGASKLTTNWFLHKFLCRPKRNARLWRDTGTSNALRLAYKQYEWHCVIGKDMTENQNDLKQHTFHPETEWGIFEILWLLYRHFLGWRKDDMNS